MLTALLRSALTQALKGSAGQQRYVLDLIQKVEGERAAEHKELLRVAIETKAEGEKELARRKRAGITDTSDIIPHPDHILIDHQTGAVQFLGHPWPEHLARFTEQQAKERKRSREQRGRSREEQGHATAPDSPTQG